MNEWYARAEPFDKAILAEIDLNTIPFEWPQVLGPY